MSVSSPLPFRKPEPPPSDADRADLAAWLAGRDEAAFHRLVERHAAMVAATCRRRLGPGADADEAVQAVFILLARRAAAVRPESAGPWLHQVAIGVCRNAQRAANRRRRHEQGAAMHRTSTSAAQAWVDLRPDLDEALLSLNQAQRALVVEHFLAGQPQDVIAARLGISEDAARMRIGYAVARLRSWFARRGLAVSAVALAAGLASEGGATEPVLVEACVHAVRTPDAAAGATALAAKSSLPVGLIAAGAALAALILVVTGTVAWRAWAGSAAGQMPSLPPSAVSVPVASTAPAVAPVGLGPARVAWSMGGYPYVSPTGITPIVAGGMVIFASRHRVLGVSTTGARLWEVEVDAWYHRPAVAGDRVVIAESSRLSCRTLAGSEVWTAPLTGIPPNKNQGLCAASPVIAGGRIILPCRDGTIRSYALTDGAEQWVWRGSGDLSTAAVVGEMVLCSERPHGIEAHSLVTGELLWRTPLVDVTDNAPVIFDGVVYATTSASTSASPPETVVALDLVDGARRWSTTLGQGILGGPALSGEVLVVTGGEEVVGLARGDGHVLWHLARPHNGTEHVVVDQRGRVLLGGSPKGGNRITLLDPASGRRLLDLPIDPLANQAKALMWNSLKEEPQRLSVGGFDVPMAAAGRLYLATSAGWFTAIDLPDMVPPAAQGHDYPAGDG